MSQIISLLFNFLLCEIFVLQEMPLTARIIGLSACDFAKVHKRLYRTKSAILKMSNPIPMVEALIR